MGFRTNALFVRNPGNIMLPENEKFKELKIDFSCNFHYDVSNCFPIYVF